MDQMAQCHVVYHNVNFAQSPTDQFTYVDLPYPPQVSYWYGNKAAHGTRYACLAHSMTTIRDKFCKNELRMVGLGTGNAVFRQYFPFVPVTNVRNITGD